MVRSPGAQRDARGAGAQRAWSVSGGTVDDECAGQLSRRERTVLVRRIGAGLLLVAALVNLGSALTPPFRQRLQALALWTQLPAGPARDGHRPDRRHRHRPAPAGPGRAPGPALGVGGGRACCSAWPPAPTSSRASTSRKRSSASASLAFLVVTRRHFRAPTNRESVRRGVGTLLVGRRHHHRGRHHRRAGLPPPHGAGPAPPAPSASAWSGCPPITIGGRLDTTLTIALAAVGIGLAVSFGWLLVRPVAHRRLGVGDLARRRPGPPRPPRRRHPLVLRPARRQAAPPHRRHAHRLRRAQRRVPRLARSHRAGRRAGRRVVGLPRPRHPPGLERGRAGGQRRLAAHLRGERHVAPLHRRRGRRRHRGVLARAAAP